MSLYSILCVFQLFHYTYFSSLFRGMQEPVLPFLRFIEHVTMKGLKKRKTSESCGKVCTGLTARHLLEPVFTGYMNFELSKLFGKWKAE